MIIPPLPSSPPVSFVDVSVYVIDAPSLIVSLFLLLVREYEAASFEVSLIVKSLLATIVLKSTSLL